MSANAATGPRIDIVGFEPTLAADFARLNYAWINKYFGVEQIDRDVLEDPQSAILAAGGEILFARVAGRIVGTVALRVEDERTFELTKMAVDEAWQGRGIGRQLLDAAIERARQRGANRVILFSARILEPAIAMYRKAGFVEVPVGGGSCYARCNIKMERQLVS